MPFSSAYSELSLADQDVTARIAQQLFSHKNFAFIVVGHDWKVRRGSENLPVFGFPCLDAGVDVTDHLDILVGLETTSELDLPIVFSPNDAPVRVLLLPSEESLTIIINDAKDEYEGRQLLQQKANENELLLATQSRLLKDIELAHAQLSEKNALLEEAAKLQNSFLTGVSHEFRTPLSSVIGYTHLLQRELRTDAVNAPLALERVQAVQRGSKHLLSLVENLLDHGKFDSQEITLNPQPLNLDEMFHDVMDVLRPLALEKDLALNYSFSGSKDDSAMIDAGRLRQCLFNLIGNAIKYTHSGAVSLHVNVENEFLDIKVKDSGLGISAADLNRIKEPFFQVDSTSRSGAGLGLSITERIVELMGGELNIESQLGQGTIVEFSIVAPSCELASAAESESSAENFRAMSILLAEDDQDIAELMTCLLEERGMTVSLADNGRDAVDIFAQNNFDLVLMDLYMPEMDGYQAAKQIRARDAHTVIIALTASTFGENGDQLDKALFDAYLTKPVNVNDILVLAEDLVDVSI